MNSTVNIDMYKFSKEEDGRWYIVIPDWAGKKAELEMVEGADIMLDYVGKGSNSVELMLSENPFEGATPITLTRDCSDDIGGGMYLLESYEGELLNQEMWLCEVTEWVFVKLPTVIYFRKVN